MFLLWYFSNTGFDILVFINGIPVGAGVRLFKGSEPSPKLGELTNSFREH